MIPEACPGCGRHLLVEKIANLTVKCEPTPLTGQEAVDYLLQGGRTLWKVDAGKIRPARMGEPGPVREHRCPVTAQEALSRPRSASSARSVQPTPPRPPVGQQTPSSGPQTAPSSARSVETPRSDDRSRAPLGTEPCDACRKPVILDGPELYASAELGATVVWAIHADCLGAS